MDNTVFELLDRLEADVWAFVSANPLVVAALVLLLLLMRWMNRLYARFVSAGQERMGLYVVAGLQSWMLAAAVTAPVWWGAVFGTKPFAMVPRELWLQPTFLPDAMVFGTAGLLLAMAAIAVAASAIEDALQIKPTRWALLIYPRTTRETITFSLFVSPTAGFCEEVVFRGVVFMGLAQATQDVWLSVALSSALFGIAHAAYGLLNVVATAAMGVVLAFGVLHTGSLWPAIVAHALYDMAVPLLVRLDELAAAEAKTGG